MEPDAERFLREKDWPRAFEAILDIYEKKVFRLVFAMVGNQARAEEVTQEVLFKVWQALERYDGRALLGTWIYTIARNTTLTHLRAETYRKTLPLDSAPAEALATRPTLQESGDSIRNLVDRLPEEQREVVVLYYYQEKSVEDVAKMLDLPVGTVKSHMFRARKALAGLIRGAAL